MIEEYEGDPTICSVCREYLAAKIIFGEVLCYDCALYFVEKYYLDYLQKTYARVERMAGYYEKAYQEKLEAVKESNQQYQNLAQVCHELLSTNGKQKTRRKKAKV